MNTQPPQPPSNPPAGTPVIQSGPFQPGTFPASPFAALGQPPTAPLPPGPPSPTRPVAPGAPLPPASPPGPIAPPAPRPVAPTAPLAPPARPAAPTAPLAPPPRRTPAPAPPAQPPPTPPGNPPGGGGGGGGQPPRPPSGGSPASPSPRRRRKVAAPPPPADTPPLYQMKGDNWTVTKVTLLLNFTIGALAYALIVRLIPGVWLHTPIIGKVVFWLLPLAALLLQQFTPRVDAVYHVTSFSRSTGWILTPGLSFVFRGLLKTSEAPGAHQVSDLSDGTGTPFTCRFTNLADPGIQSAAAAAIETARTKVLINLIPTWMICDAEKATVKMGLQPGEAVEWTTKDGKPGKHQLRLLKLITPIVSALIQEEMDDEEVEAIDVVSGNYNSKIQGKANLDRINESISAYGIRVLKLSAVNPRFEKDEDARAVAAAGTEPLERRQEKADAATTKQLFEDFLAQYITAGFPQAEAREKAWIQTLITQGKMDATVAGFAAGLNKVFGGKLGGLTSILGGGNNPRPGQNPGNNPKRPKNRRRQGGGGNPGGQNRPQGGQP